MKKLIWLSLLLPLVAYGATQINNDLDVNGDVLPRVSGKDLGSTTRRWDAWLANINGSPVVPYEPAITAGTSLQYWRGDKTFQTLNTAAVPELTNLYFTDARARGALSATAPISYNSGTGVFSCVVATGSVAGCLSAADFAIFNAKEPAISAGTSLQYYRGDKTFQTLNTLAVPELTNLYFTDTRARTAAVADSITNGVTNIAPSQNATFDALALKADDSAVVKLAGTQTVTGAKTFSAASTINLPAIPQISVATTGNIDALDTSANVSIRLTGAAPVLRGIANGANGKLATIINASGVSISVTNENATPTAANRIITGTGADLTLANTASLFLQYDSTSSRWRVIGGSGGAGGGNVTGPASSTDNAIARFDLATGKIIQNSVVTVGDTGIIAGATLPAASVSYTPTTPANWLSVPTQGQQALDNLAAQRPVINLMSEGVSYTPTFTGLGTVSGVDVKWKRIGNTMEIWGSATLGTPTATPFSITLPAGHTIDTTQVVANRSPQGFAQGLFTGGTWSNNGQTQTGFYDGSDATKIFTGFSGTGGSYVKGNGNDYSTAGNGIAFRFQVPIAEWAQATTVDIFAAGDTGWQDYSLTIGGSGGGPTKGTIVADRAQWRRQGDSVEIIYTYQQSAAGAAGNGVYLFPLPPGLSADTSKVTVGTTALSAATAVGSGYAYTNTATEGIGSVFMYNATNMAFRIVADFSSASVANSNGYASSTFRGLDRPEQGYKFRATIPISGWSTFPIGVATQQGPRSYVRVHTGNGHGSTNDKIRRFSTVIENVGTAITYADSSTLGASFTINEDGIYSMSYSDPGGSPTYWGVSLNSNQLTTSIKSITGANLLVLNANSSGTETSGTAAVTIPLSAGDVIRPHTNGNTSQTDPNTTSFIITKIAN